jgi:hypothetical protein
VVEQSSLHRQIERSAHDHVNFEHGLWREPITVAAAGCGQVLVEIVEVVARSRRNGTCPMAGAM